MQEGSRRERRRFEGFLIVWSQLLPLPLLLLLLAVYPVVGREKKKKKKPPSVSASVCSISGQRGVELPASQLCS